MLMRYTFDDYEQINTEQVENDKLSEQTIQDFEELYKLVNEYIATLPPVTANEYPHYDKKNNEDIINTTIIENMIITDNGFHKHHLKQPN